MHTSVVWAHLRRAATGIALCLGLTAVGSTSATAAVLYDFSLAANGAVGPVRSVVGFSDFLPSTGLFIIPATSAEVVTLTSGTPIDPTLSVAGLDSGPAATLFGVSLTGAGGGLVLRNEAYPTGLLRLQPHTDADDATPPPD